MAWCLPEGSRTRHSGAVACKMERCKAMGRKHVLHSREGRLGHGVRQDLCGVSLGPIAIELSRKIAVSTHETRRQKDVPGRMPWMALAC